MGVDPLSSAAVFLDRDGVLNRALVGADGIPRPPKTVEQVEILPRVPEALERLRSLGFALVVVTNQPDIARGSTTAKVVEAIHGRLRDALGLEDFRTCPHDDADACACRKPEPGLLLRAASDRVLDLARSYMVGDRWRDIEAGHRAGCRTILLDSGHRERLLSEPDHRAASLWEAALWIEEREMAGGRAE